MRMSYLLKSLLMTSAAVGLTACGGDDKKEILVFDQAPIAILSYDSNSIQNGDIINVTAGTTINFDTSGSFDPEDGKSINYYWDGSKQDNSSRLFDFEAGDSEDVSFYVEDSAGNSSNTITFTVKKKVTGENQAPIAKLTDENGSVLANGATISIKKGTTLELSAADSTDPDGDKLSYKWSDGSTASSFSKAYTAAGKVSVTVSDPDGESSQITINVNVTEGCTPVASFTPSGDKLITAGESITFDASGSSCEGGEIGSYEWLIDGESYSGITKTLTFNEEKTFTAKLIVTAEGDDSATAENSINVTVNPAPCEGPDCGDNNAPVADIVLPSAEKKAGTTIVVDGSHSTDADNDTLTYQWSVSGDASIDGSSTNDTVSLSLDAVGSATVTLVVNDGTEASVAESVTFDIVSGGGDNTAPVADIVVPDTEKKKGTTITVDGSGSTDADDDALTYKWSVSENASITGSDSNETVTLSLDTAGSATVTLVVNDGTVDSEEQSSTFTITEAEVTETEFTWDNANVYFVLTDRFYNGNENNDESYGRKKNYGSAELNTGTFHGGDIAGLTQKLEEGYFTDLGVNAIWISAPYEQIHGWTGGGDSGAGGACTSNCKTFPHYAYHGYYPMDFTMIDQNMGTVEEFRTFVDTAHELGIRVLMDVVMNHVGYNTLLDMEQYNFGGFNSGFDSSWTVSDATGSWGWDGVWQAVDWDTSNWGNWWTNDWIAAGLPTYDNRTATVEQDPISSSLNNLPDVRTETYSAVGAPKFLKDSKWVQESTGFDQWIIPAAATLRTDMNESPAGYITKWLAAWVEEFGIDGFRIDTAKHVQIDRWSGLKDASAAALEKWRAKHAGTDKPGADWDDAFWTTGEVWAWGLGGSVGYDSTYHGTGKFDSMISFGFPKDGNTSTIGSTWATYASAINNADWNALFYLNSHDHKANYGWNPTSKAHGTTLLLSPGGVQIYYGDENARPLGVEVDDPNQSTRSDYKWGDNPEILAHWQKLGKYRHDNPAIGAGSHNEIGSSSGNAYARRWVSPKTGNENNAVFVINASGDTIVDVVKGSTVYFADGSTVRNAYDGTTATVAAGKVTFAAGSEGVILIEAQ